MGFFLDRELIYKLADLSKISLEEEDVDSLIDSIDNVLRHIESLDQLDVENIAPMIHPFTPKTPFADFTSTNQPTESILRNAPEKIGSFIRVPVVLNNQD